MGAFALAVALCLGQVDDFPPFWGIKINGFAADGRYFVYTGAVDWNGEPENPEDVPRTKTVFVDLLTGQLQIFRDGEGAAYLKKHPVVAASPSRTSPDGKATAEVVVSVESSAGGWSAGRWNAGVASSWELSVTRDGKTTRAASSSQADGVEVSWSRDGKHTVWLVSSRSHDGPRSPGSTQVVLGTDGRPSVAMVMDKASVKTTGVKLAETLSKAGFSVLQTGPAKQKREKSVVFAAAGFEVVAKALAAAVPGGATVEKLSWKANTDLVVYAGPDALK